MDFDKKKVKVIMVTRNREDQEINDKELVFVEFLLQRTKRKIYDIIHLLRKGKMGIAEEYTQEVINERRE